MLRITGVHHSLRRGERIAAEIKGKSAQLTLRHDLSERQIDLLLAGGVINWLRSRGGRTDSRR